MTRRDTAIAQIEKRLERVDAAYDSPGLCLYYAHHTATVLRQHGYKAVIQAGSLQWPRMSREYDDGVNPTHFAYIWSPQESASTLALSMGFLPEIHVWVGIVDRQEIVDFSTRNLKDAAARRGFTWEAPDPPQYLWCKPDKLISAWVLYEPERDATLFACAIIKRLFNPSYLKKMKLPC